MSLSVAHVRDSDFPDDVIPSALQRPQGGPAIPLRRRENLEFPAFVIYRTPQAIRLTIDLNEHLVQLPAPLRKRPVIVSSP